MSVRSRRARIIVLVLACVAFPRFVSNSADGQDKAVLRGRVTGTDGAGLADVRVRAVVGTVDMRFVDSSTGHAFLDAKSDAKGDYRLEIPGIAKPTAISIDAMKPGYRRLVGTPRAGGDARTVEVSPGKEARADLILEPARYLAGVVYDERGKPVPGVKIAAILTFGRSTGGIERTVNSGDGSFELFNYPVDPAARDGEAGKGVVMFSHPGYNDLTFEDVYTLGPDQLKVLKIVLESGHTLSGTVRDAAGKPVANAMVQAVGGGRDERKATLTDANGKFALRGLTGGSTVLTARALAIKQKGGLEMEVRGDRTDLDVRLKAMALPADLKTHAVLGMKLADVTPEMKSAYELAHARGAPILDPGKDFERLNVGELAEGYVLWMVGNKRIGSVREFADQILAETAKQGGEPYSVRVVYSFSTPESDGSNTQFLKLTKDDLKKLRAVSEGLKAGSR